MANYEKDLLEQIEVKYNEIKGKAKIIKLKWTDQIDEVDIAKAVKLFKTKYKMPNVNIQIDVTPDNGWDQFGLTIKLK